jgi:hypothetical protein
MFEVIWLEEAVNDLAEMWTRADSAGRRAITEATNAIDRTLGSNPIGSSESRTGDQRILFAEPLGALFKVDRQRRIVRVGHVWQYRGHAK